MKLTLKFDDTDSDASRRAGILLSELGETLNPPEPKPPRVFGNRNAAVGGSGPARAGTAADLPSFPASAVVAILNQVMFSGVPKTIPAVMVPGFGWAIARPGYDEPSWVSDEEAMTDIQHFLRTQDVKVVMPDAVMEKVVVRHLVTREDFEMLFGSDSWK